MGEETLQGTESIVEAVTEAVTQTVTEQTQQTTTQATQSLQNLPSEMTVSLNTITFIILIAIAVLLAVGLIFSLLMLKNIHEKLEETILSSKNISSDTTNIKRIISDLKNKMDKAEEERKNREHHEHSRQMSMQNQMYHQSMSSNGYPYKGMSPVSNGCPNPAHPSQNEWQNTVRQDNRTENYPNNYPNRETNSDYSFSNRQETEPSLPKRELVGSYSVSNNAFSQDIILSKAVSTALFSIYSDDTVEVNILEQQCGFYIQRKLGSVFTLESQSSGEIIDLTQYIDNDLSIKQLKKTARVEPLNDGTYRVIDKGTLVIDIYDSY